jgi:hypothetical protein
MEILTGMPAGARDRAGTFPDGTVNHRVEERLIAFARQARAFGVPSEAPREPTLPGHLG